MDKEGIDIVKKMYLGYLKTPQLWIDSLNGIIQWPLMIISDNSIYNLPPLLESRLGKRVEQFVFNEFTNHNIDIVAQNIQIQNSINITLGEIDCIVKSDDIYSHIEIVYKFYLYDNSVGESELDHWIGPNRRDSLIKKLNKIESKQLPLLYKPETKQVILDLNKDIEIEKMTQHVFFKAQLYLPYGKTITFDKLNKKCLYGFYIPFKRLNIFKGYQFYFPSKLDWIIEPHHDVEWMSYDDIYRNVKILINNNISSLSWIKKLNGEIEKLFIVWW